MFSAKIIADSKSSFGHRITTFVVTMPRIVLAEFNTHRMFSRNSASSRAIPFKKMVNSVMTNPFIPMKWMKEHSGMQGNEYFESGIGDLEDNWLRARDAAVERATELHERGLTKQMCNRLLEPFMWHTVVVTATEWDNFFALRAHEAAEIHIQHLAFMMLDEYNKSTPRLLEDGEWHIPFHMDLDIDDACKQLTETGRSVNDLPELWNIKVATARLARISYTLIGEEHKPTDYKRDIELHDRLASMGHWSPMEHCARAMSGVEYYESGWDIPASLNAPSRHANRSNYGWCGNFRGFIQYRKTFQNENKIDSRIENKD